MHAETNMFIMCGYCKQILQLIQALQQMGLIVALTVKQLKGVLLRLDNWSKWTFLNTFLLTDKFYTSEMVRKRAKSLFLV